MESETHRVPAHWPGRCARRRDIYKMKGKSLFFIETTFHHGFLAMPRGWEAGVHMLWAAGSLEKLKALLYYRKKNSQYRSSNSMASFLLQGTVRTYDYE